MIINRIYETQNLLSLQLVSFLVGLRTCQHPFIFWFDGENISFDASLVICINSTNIPPIMIINRIYETQNLLSLQLVSFLVGLRTYQHPCICASSINAHQNYRPTHWKNPFICNYKTISYHQYEYKNMSLSYSFAKFFIQLIF